jgi:hypothetical protein
MVATRVKETSTTPGTVSFTLGGAVTGFVTFNTAYGTSRRFLYFIEGVSGEWESGFGYLSTSTTLVREQIRQNSAGTTSALNFSAGTKNVYMAITDRAIKQPPQGWQNVSTKGVPSAHISSSTPTGVQSAGSDKMRLTPFELAFPMVATGIRIEVTTAAASSKGRMALYEVKSNGLPGNILVETGNIDTTTTGIKTGTFTAKFIHAGTYWSACAQDLSTVVFRRYAQGSYRGSLAGGNTATAAHDSGINHSLTGGWTTLPTADPTGAVLDDSAGCLFLNLVGDMI